MGAAEKIAELKQPFKPVTTLYRYNVPESCGGDIRSFALAEIKVNDELQAEVRAGGKKGKQVAELAKAALRMVNDQPVSLGDGSADKAFESMSAKVRNLLTSAYVKINIPSDEEEAAFFESAQVQVS